jgi:c-di-GMP-binding flagellar brake protein YcgR
MAGPLTEPAKGVGPNRRSEPRHPAAIPATVLINNGEPLPVIIVDLSAGGCQLRLPRPLGLPQRFDLQFRDLAYVCERRWARDLSVGVQFVDLCSRGRRRELSETGMEAPTPGARNRGDVSARPPPEASLPSSKNRRVEPRSPVDIRAMVLIPQREPLPVVIVDLSGGGCQIRLDRPLELPQRFNLQFHNLTYVCERRWKKDLSLGVQFLDLCLRAGRKELSTTGMESATSTTRYRRDNSALPPLDAYLQPGDNRRAEPRSTVEIRGMVLIPQREPLPVLIVDLSTGGCQIRLDRPLELPRQFKLQFHNLTYVCERRWAKDLSLGVQFLDLRMLARREEPSTKGMDGPTSGAHPGPRHGGETMVPLPLSASFQPGNDRRNDGVRPLEASALVESADRISRGARAIRGTAMMLIPSVLRRR